MESKRKYPVSFYFEVLFRGDTIAFQEVSGISIELNVEEIVCGGENRFKYRLPTASTNQNLVLKRALIIGDSQLIDWCVNTISGGMANKIKPYDISVNLLNADGYVSVMWTFHGAYPIKYSVSDLKSQENGLVIESIELAYTYFTVGSDTDTIFGNLFS
jgi:phage tail-like protein